MGLEEGLIVWKYSRCYSQMGQGSFEWEIGLIREGFKKSKWKFKMVFAMKGGGLEFHIPILKNDVFENHLESFPNC